MNLSSLAIKRLLAGAGGFEPTAFGFGDQRSNQLSYAPSSKCDGSLAILLTK